MANTFATTSGLVVKLITMNLWEALVAGRCVNRQVGQFVKEGYRTAGSIVVKKPIVFRASTTATITTVQDVYQRSHTITTTSRARTDFQLTGQQMTLNMLKGEVNEEILKPAGRALAVAIESAIMSLYAKIPNQVGTPGTAPDDKTVRQARERLTYLGCPVNDCHCILDPAAVTEIGQNIQAIFHQPMVGAMVQQAPIDGELPIKLHGFKCYESIYLKRHTVGTAQGDTLLVKTTGTTEDTTIAIKGGTSANIMEAGDIFTCADSYAVNPEDGTAYTFLRQFVAMSDGTVDASTNIDAQACVPGTAPYNIRTAAGDADKDPYQNISLVPTQDKAVTVAGTAGTAYGISLAFHRNALCLATIELEKQEMAPFCENMTFEGISVQVSADYDVKNHLTIWRADVLYGVDVLEPMGACRIIGS